MAARFAIIALAACPATGTLRATNDTIDNDIRMNCKMTSKLKTRLKMFANEKSTADTVADEMWGLISMHIDIDARTNFSNALRLQRERVYWWANDWFRAMDESKAHGPCVELRQACENVVVFYSKMRGSAHDLAYMAKYGSVQRRINQAKNDYIRVARGWVTTEMVGARNRCTEKAQRFK